MRIGYLCDGSNAVGWGHVGRGRALLEVASVDSVLIVGHGWAEVRAWSRRAGMPFQVQPWHARDQPLESVPGPFDVLVVDHYGLDGRWIGEAASHCPVFVIDDWMRSTLRATGLINANVGASLSDYTGLDVQQALVGPAFALTRTEVLAGRDFPTSDPSRPNVLVTFGGSDPGGRTAAVADALTMAPWYRSGGLLTVVLGRSYRGPAPWAKWPRARLQGLEVVQDPPDFVRRCREATLVVCGASTTTYELAYLATPFWPVALVDNQIRVADGWRSLGVGDGLRADTPDWLTSLSRSAGHLLADSEARRCLIESSSIVDGRGRERILAACGKACAAIH